MQDHRHRGAITYGNLENPDMSQCNKSMHMKREINASINNKEEEAEPQGEPTQL